MPLVDHQIHDLCLGKVPWYIRLPYFLIGSRIGKIQPMVEPFNPYLVNPHSLDICIGSAAKLRTVHGYIDIDLSLTNRQNPYLIYPGDRILVESLEVFHIPEFVASSFYLKSSRGREWYGHQLAGYIDAGWHSSRLTMEITNDDLDALPIYKGMQFGQLEFRLLFGKPKKSYAVTGRYNNHKSVHCSLG